MSDTNTNWWTIRNIDLFDSPALVVYEERVKRNIATAIAMIKDIQRLRPHVKTHKMPAVTRLMLDAGIQKFKCATIAEAEMLAMESAPDVLLAYQPVGPKLLRLISLVKKYPAVRFSCLIDNEAAAQQISDAFLQEGLTINVWLDINTGMNRTGIVAGPDATQLYVSIALLEGIQPIGLHLYDGNIRDADWNERKRHCDEVFNRVLLMQQHIGDRGFGKPIIIAGGSPTFSIHAARETVECSPGTFVFWDKGYSDLCPEQDFQPAALVISRIISKPAHGKICLDLGHKSIASENELPRRVFFMGTPDWKPVSQSEEHLVIETGHDANYHIGELFYGIPIHICPTVALYEMAWVVTNHEITEEWKIVARDRRINV